MTNKTPLPIEGHDSSPTIPLTNQQRVRLGDLARQLDQARVQGYVEANLVTQLLQIVQQLVPLFLQKG